MKTTKRFLILAFGLMGYSLIFAQPAQNPQTFCNPLNLSYRFMVDAVDAREAADPVIILFKGDYYLFASRSGGYWTSPDLRNWTFIVPTGIDIETYAPGVLVMRDSVFYIPSGSPQVYKTADPKSGIWTLGPKCDQGYGDPAFFLDDDGRLYMYYGLSNTSPTSVVELDPITFKEIGKPVNVVFADTTNHGWERRGEGVKFEEDLRPWIEGCWMVKQNGKYYLHYSAPGTEWKTYSDGIYVSDSPMGPFTYAPYSPIDFKPTGFVCGGGHGATFKDKDGHYWHIGTMTISQKHIFERRLALFPVGFDEEDQIYTNTTFGDYPQYFPGIKDNPEKENFAGMMLLSHKKFVLASSALEGYGPEKAVDEEIRTYWSAVSGDPNEWLMIDLGKECTVEAIQVNFAEHRTNPDLVRGRDKLIYQQYIIEKSLDGMNWEMLVDKSQNMQDVPHDYIELENPVPARYIKLTNVFTPGQGTFAVRDLRIFGNSDQAVFTKVHDFTVERNPADGRDAIIRWSPVPGADGYIIRYGIAPNKLYNHYIVYDVDSVFIRSLNRNVDYYFEVEAFDSGTEYYQPVGEFRSFQTGEWNDVFTWAQFDGTTWIHPTPHVPTFEDGPVTILEGHTVTVSSDVLIDQLTVENGGSLIIPKDITLHVKDGIGTDLMVYGTVRNFGDLISDSKATLCFANEGFYEHAQNGGRIPLATWRPNSTCLIDSVKAKAPSNGNQNFYNVVWNCPDQTANLNMGWNGNTIGGNITIISTGTGRWQMCAPSAGDSTTVTIKGGIIQSGGQFTSNGTSNPNTTIVIHHEGNIEVTGGNFSVSRGSQGGSGTTVWYLSGNVSLENAKTQNSNPSGAKFVFTGQGKTQALTFSNVTFGGGGFPVEIDSGAVVDIGTSILEGNGSFRIKNGGTLITAHSNGIDGSITTTGSKQFDKASSYGFNGTSPQVTGNSMPDTVFNLILNNPQSVGLSHSVVVIGTVEIVSGALSLADHALTYGPNASLKYSGTSAQTTTDVEFPALGGPSNLIIANSKGVTLHAPRTIRNLELSGKLDIGTHTLTAIFAATTDPRAFVATGNGGMLKMLSVGASPVFFPVGTISYAPVWVTNYGAVDNISVGAVKDDKPAPCGGRVKVKWIIIEETHGDGNYTLQFGWAPALETSDFRADRARYARIFNLTDTTEAGSGEYTMQLATSPYTISRGGITQLGPFAVGLFRTPTGVRESPGRLPMEFYLWQNYPNPFNASTAIRFALHQDSKIKIVVYDLLGKEITTLIDAKMEAGEHTIHWNAEHVASGIYVYKLFTKGFVLTRKMIVLK